MSRGMLHTCSTWMNIFRFWKWSFLANPFLVISSNHVLVLGCCPNWVRLLPKLGMKPHKCVICSPIPELQVWLYFHLVESSFWRPKRSLSSLPDHRLSRNVSTITASVSFMESLTIVHVECNALVLHATQAVSLQQSSPRPFLRFFG